MLLQWAWAHRHFFDILISVLLNWYSGRGLLNILPVFPLPPSFSFSPQVWSGFIVFLLKAFPCGGGGVLFCLESLSSLLASRHPCSLCVLTLLYHRLVVCLAELRPYYFWPITLGVTLEFDSKESPSLGWSRQQLRHWGSVNMTFKWLCKLSSQEWKNCKDGLSVLLTISKL